MDARLLSVISKYGFIMPKTPRFLRCCRTL
jgi:hypothetical protein